MTDTITTGIVSHYLGVRTLNPLRAFTSFLCLRSASRSEGTANRFAPIAPDLDLFAQTHLFPPHTRCVGWHDAGLGKSVGCIYFLQCTIRTCTFSNVIVSGVWVGLVFPIE